MKTYIKRVLSIVFCALSMSGCNIGAGTLGGFDERKVYVSKEEFLTAIRSLDVSNIPQDLEGTAKSIQDNYSFMDSYCLYFSAAPEEMYFVTFRGNSKVTVMSVRSIFQRGRWYVEKDLSESERERIEERFDKDVIAKIKALTNAKVVRVKDKWYTN